MVLRLVIVLLAVAACGKAQSPPARVMPSPFSVLGEVRLGISYDELLRHRPGISGDREVGGSEAVGGKEFSYSMSGTFGPQALFVPGTLQVVRFTIPVPSDSVGARIMDSIRASFGKPWECVRSEGEPSVWRTKVEGTEIVMRLSQMVVYRHSQGTDTVPRKVGLTWRTPRTGLVAGTCTP